MTSLSNTVAPQISYSGSYFFFVVSVSLHLQSGLHAAVSLIWFYSINFLGINSVT